MVTKETILSFSAFILCFSLPHIYLKQKTGEKNKKRKKENKAKIKKGGQREKEDKKNAHKETKTTKNYTFLPLHS